MELLLFFGFFDDRPNLLYTGKHGGELEKMRAGLFCDNAGQGCFPATGRTPEDHGKGPIFYHRVSEHRTLSDGTILPEEIVQPSGPHPFSQGSCGIGGFLCAVFKKIHGINVSLGQGFRDGTVSERRDGWGFGPNPLPLGSDW